MYANNLVLSPFKCISRHLGFVTKFAIYIIAYLKSGAGGRSIVIAIAPLSMDHKSNASTFFSEAWRLRFEFRSAIYDHSSLHILLELHHLRFYTLLRRRRLRWWWWWSAPFFTPTIFPWRIQPHLCREFCLQRPTTIADHISVRVCVKVNPYKLPPIATYVHRFKHACIREQRSGWRRKKWALG